MSELLVGQADEHRLAERIGELDAAEGGAEVPGAVLQVEPDPVEAGAGRGLDHQRFRHRQPAGETHALAALRR